MNYKTLSIEALHNLIVQKKLSPSKLHQMVLKECQKLSKTNVLNYINAHDEAELSKLDATIEVDNWLYGIPYIAKDNIATKNIPTTSSSNILKGYIPTFDATIIRKLNAKKMLMVGKAALDELGMGGVGLFSCNGPIYNPYDVTRLVGGSSSGSAYLVAKGVVPFAIGTDTGDSIRKPASFNNIVGFKPSYGAISRYGLLPYSPSLDTIGFLTRNVNDTAILADACFGYDPADFTSINLPDQDFYARINNFDNQKTFGYIPWVIESLPTSLRKAYTAFFNDLKTKGYQVKQIDFDPQLLAAVTPIYMMISYSESASTNANLDGIKFGTRVDGTDYEQLIKNSRTQGFGSVVKKRFLIGSLNLNKENQTLYLNKAKQVRRLIVQAMQTAFEAVDVLIIPPFYDVAPLVTSVQKPSNPKYKYLEDILILANLNGSPSITIPFVKKNGLGIGINLMTKPQNDLLCLQAAKVCENIIGIKDQIVGVKYE